MILGSSISGRHVRHFPAQASGKECMHQSSLGDKVRGSSMSARGNGTSAIVTYSWRSSCSAHKKIRQASAGHVQIHL
eukprot:scaffold254223_cov27-Tisochrysis_lutea.AAC.1